LFWKDKIDELWTQEEEGPYNQILHAHNILVNNLDAKGPSAMMKVTRYRLIGDVKVKTGPFNKKNMELEKRLQHILLRVGYRNGREILAPIPVVYWHVCLDLPPRFIVKARNPVDSDAQLARMYHMLSIDNDGATEGGDDGMN
jgi:hypothetical protein